MAKKIETSNGKKGGLLEGATHENGGIKAVVVTDNNRPVELEHGEVIINAKSVKKDWKKLDKINRDGGGVPIGPPQMKKGGTIQKKCPVGTEIQTILFDKKTFTGAQAKSWLKQHNFKTGVDEGITIYRFRQQAPNHFKKKSFKTIQLTKGVQAVIGCPTQMKTGGNLKNANHENIEKKQGKKEENIKSCVSYIRAGIGAAKEKQPINIELQLAFKFAKEKKIWIEDISSLPKPIAGGGNENSLYYDENESIIYKSNNLFNCGFSILNYLNYLLIHNKLFPNTKYELHGFIGLDKCFDNNENAVPYVEPVVSQRYIGGSKASQEDIEKYMVSGGFKKVDDSTYEKGEYIVSDLKPRNVLKGDDGNIYVIDNIIKEKTAPQMETGGNIKHNTMETENQPIEEIVERHVEEYSHPCTDGEKIYLDLKSCILEEGDNEASFIFEGKELINKEGGKNEKWKIVSFFKYGVNLEHATTNKLTVKHPDIKVTFDELKQMQADGHIEIFGIETSSQLNHCLKIIKKCIDNIDLKELHEASQMKSGGTVYETGATTHAVNDLILFTDNTAELAKLRDSIYEKYTGDKLDFNHLLLAAIRQYHKEFPTSSNHITSMKNPQRNEYRTLYAKEYDSWKADHMKEGGPILPEDELKNRLETLKTNFKENPTPVLKTRIKIIETMLANPEKYCCGGPVEMDSGGQIKTYVQWKSAVLESVGSRHYLRYNQQSWQLTDEQLKELLEKLDPISNPLSAANFIVGVDKSEYKKLTMKKGGSIPNNYKGKTPEQIWNSWNKNQRAHFISDHEVLSPLKKIEYDYLSTAKWSDIPDDIEGIHLKGVISQHISQGQYGKGANIRAFGSKLFSKTKDITKKGYQSAKTHTKSAAEKSKKYVDKKIHDKKKDIAYEVLQDTRVITDDKRESQMLNEASNIVEEKYKKGGNVKKSAAASKVLQLMDKDYEYQDALKKVLSEDKKLNKKKLEKELNKYI